MVALALLVVAAAWLGMAQAAQAGVITKSGTKLVYSGGAADNYVQLVFCATGGGCGTPQNVLLFADGGEAMTVNAPGSGCAPWAPNSSYIACPPAGITGVDVSLGVGSDTVALNPCSQPPGTCGLYPVPVELTGGGGNDSLSGGPLGDSLNGGTGGDSLNGMDLDDVLTGGTGADTMNGGIGIDLVTYDDHIADVTVELSSPGANDGSSEDGAAGSRDNVNSSDIEQVRGGAGDDVLNGTGHGSELRLDGGPGGDTLTAGSVSATLIGDVGNDALAGGNAADTLEAGAGNDSLLPDDGADTVRAGAGMDSVDSRDGVADSINCGGNRDSLLTDPVDTLAECDDPAPPAPPTTTPTTSTTLQRIVIGQRLRARPGRRSTRLAVLTVTRIPAGSRLIAKCRTNRNRRCPRTRDFAKSNARGNVRLRSFERKALPVGAKLEIRVTKPGMNGAVKVLTIRRNRQPSVATRCLPPGAGRPAACS